MRTLRTYPAAVAALAVATCVSSTALGYRTAENSLEFVGAGPVGWATKDVRFVMHDNVPAGLASDVVMSTVGLAVAQWAAIGCGQPKMWLSGYGASDALPGDGINTIRWVTLGWARYGFPASAAAITDVQYEQGTNGKWTIVEADIYLNAEGYDWSGIKPGSQSLGAVTLHEAGHVLGLLHPCEISGLGGAPDCAADPGFAAAVMFPTYQQASIQLGSDDIAGVCYLYPGGPCPAQGCGAGELCTSQGCQASCGDMVCLAGYTCVEGACVDITTVQTAKVAPASTCPPSGCVSQASTNGGNVWDICQASTDCSPGLICSSGYCAAFCTTQADCPANATCSATGRCETAQGVFGQQCKQADDCASLVCLEQGQNGGVCSRSCGDGTVGCPAGWSCTNPDGLGSICVASRPDDGCGCRMVGSSRQTGTAGTALLASLILLSLRTRKKGLVQ